MDNTRQRLYMFDLPLIEDIKSLATNTRLSKALLYHLSKNNERFYATFQLRKENGGFRDIACPSYEMKAVQAWILRNILDKIHISDSATGFRLGKSILDNASTHKGNRYFLCLDIENFFPSILYPKIYTVFRTIGYNAHISHVFTSLCTYKGILPQGAVTSPALSNIICIRLDHRISAYVGKYNVTYSRYADDLTFSCLRQNQLPRIKSFVSQILKAEGFKVNENKTRFLGPRRRRKVTGMVISDHSISIGKYQKKILRATIHKCLHLNDGDQQKRNLIMHINGWIALLKAVDPIGKNQLIKYTAKLMERNNISDFPFNKGR